MSCKRNDQCHGAVDTGTHFIEFLERRILLAASVEMTIDPLLVTAVAQSEPLVIAARPKTQSPDSLAPLAPAPSFFTLSNNAPYWDARLPAGPAVVLNWTTSTGTP